MESDEELFTHEVKVWTVGDLRKALEDVADELPVRAFIAEEPGGGTADEQVVYGGCPWSDQGKDTPPQCFSLECEFPPGQYYRRKR